MGKLAKDGYILKTTRKITFEESVSSITHFFLTCPKFVTVHGLKWANEQKKK